MELSGLNMFLTMHMRSDLVKRWNGFLKTQLQHQLCDAGCIYFESPSTICYCVFQSQDPKVQNQGGEGRMVALAINPGDPLAGILLPVPMILCPGGLEVLVPERRRLYKEVRC